MIKPVTGTYEYTRDSDRWPYCFDYPDNHCLPHFHSSLEFNYVLKGEMKATLDGKTQRVKAGEIVLVPSYVVHTFTTDKVSDTLVLIIPLDYLPSMKPIFQRNSFRHLIVKDPQWSSHDTAVNASEFLTILEILSSSRYLPDHPTYRGYVQALIGLAIDYGELIEDSHNPTGELGRDILSYLQEHFREDLSLDELATHFGYSKSRFSHIFNERFQTNLTAYLNSLRCREAASQIREGTPQLEAAMQAGFENIRTFYRAFQQYFHETPSDYIRRMSAGS